jgi:hypothetical protein
MRRKIFSVLALVLALMFSCLVASDAQRMVHPTTGKSYPLYAAPYSAVSPPFGLSAVIYAMSTNYTAMAPVMLTPASNIPTRTLGVMGMLARVDSLGTCDIPLAGIIRGVALVDNTTNFAANITTNASTVVYADKSILGKININVAGTTSTVALYNDSTSPCDSNYVGTFQTTATGIIDINHSFSNAICALTAGATPADISLLYRAP